MWPSYDSVVCEQCTRARTTNLSGAMRDHVIPLTHTTLSYTQADSHYIPHSHARSINNLTQPPSPASPRFYPPFSFPTITPFPFLIFFFLNNPAPPEISPLPLHAPLPIFKREGQNSDPPRRHFLLRTQGDHWIDGGRTAGRQVPREQSHKKKEHGDKRGGWEVAWGKVEEHAGD